MTCDCRPLDIRSSKCKSLDGLLTMIGNTSRHHQASLLTRFPADSIPILTGVRNFTHHSPMRLHPTPRGYKSPRIQDTSARRRSYIHSCLLPLFGEDPPVADRLNTPRDDNRTFVRLVETHLPLLQSGVRLGVSILTHHLHSRDFPSHYRCGGTWG